MGCSASKNVVSPSSTNNNITKEESNHKNSKTPTAKPIKESEKKSLIVDKNRNNNTEGQDEVLRPSVAFDVSLDGRKLDSLISKHPPKKFQRLEPLDHQQLSADLLLEKQQLAEEKRKQALQKKREASQKTSRRRRDLVRAKEFEKEQTNQQIEDQLKTAEKLRETKQSVIIEKQKIREERAKRVRKRAKKLNDPDELEIPEIEADESYKNEDVDMYTWDDGLNIDEGLDPRKRAHHRLEPRQFSASTFDSVDNAFQNKPTLPEIGKSRTPEQDDFFDT